jgi:hypothetical protein
LPNDFGNASDLTTDGKVEKLSGSLTGSNDLTDIAGTNLNIDDDGKLNASGGSSGIQSLSGGDGISPSDIGDGDELTVAWGDANDLDSDGNVSASGADGRYLDSGDFDGPAEWENAGNRSNSASGSNAVVLGGEDNSAGGDESTVGGGDSNTASGEYDTVAGGNGNEATGSRSFIGGGVSNTADGQASVVAGGNLHNLFDSAGDYSAVGGGEQNNAGGNYSAVPGGNKNSASSPYSTALGGQNNTANGEGATIAGGKDNRTDGKAAVVAGGADNDARGDYAFAAGRNATAAHAGSFVVGDASETEVTSSGTNEMRFQMEMYTPSLNQTSSRTEKTDIESVDPEDVLDSVQSLDISTWEFTHTDDGRHIGPMAEDFQSAFELGPDEETISSIDADGVALAAIQALAERVETLERQLMRGAGFREE